MGRLLFTYLFFMQNKHTGKGRPSFVFRHFAGKRWSLFAALGQDVKVGVLSVATLSVAAAAHASSMVDLRCAINCVGDENRSVLP